MTVPEYRFFASEVGILESGIAQALMIPWTVLPGNTFGDSPTSTAFYFAKGRGWDLPS
jgi:hypothetical protein